MRCARIVLSLLLVAGWATAAQGADIVAGQGLVGGGSTANPVVKLDIGAGPGIALTPNSVRVSFAGKACGPGTYLAGFNANGTLLCRSFVTAVIPAGTYNGHKYFYGTRVVTWASGKATCQKLGGYLVVIDDAGENDFVADIEYPGSQHWIGLYQTAEGAEPDGGWTWVVTPSGSYTNWSVDEPNDSGDEDCAEQSGGSWNDSVCTDTKAFVCEVP